MFLFYLFVKSVPFVLRDKPPKLGVIFRYECRVESSANRKQNVTRSVPAVPGDARHIPIVGADGQTIVSPVSQKSPRLCRIRRNVLLHAIRGEAAVKQVGNTTRFDGYVGR